MEINNRNGINYQNKNNTTAFGCFGKRNKSTNDSVEFKNNKTENQNQKNRFGIIKEKIQNSQALSKFFNKEESSSVDDTVKRDEIKKLQKDVENVNAQNYKKYSENEKTIRTATVQKTANVKKTTGEKKNDYSNLPNPPQFSFDFDKLMSDLSKIEGAVDEKWVTENPDSAFNLINAAAKGEPFSQKQWNIISPTVESKVHWINTLISNKENFIEEVTNQYSFEKFEYINSISELLTHHDNKVVNRVIDAIRKYGDAYDLERDDWATLWSSDDENTLLNLIKTTVEIGDPGETNDTSIYYIIENSDNYSEKLVIEALKAIQSLTPNGTGWYEEILKLINKIPNDKDGEFSKILLDTLKAVGDKKNVENLDDYLRNYNHVNQYTNKGEKTPQIILDAIEDIRKTISEKEYVFVRKKTRIREDNY